MKKNTGKLNLLFETIKIIWIAVALAVIAGIIVTKDTSIFMIFWIPAFITMISLFILGLKILLDD